MLPITVHFHVIGCLLLASLWPEGEPSSLVSIQENGTAENLSLERNKNIFLLQLTTAVNSSRTFK